MANELSEHARLVVLAAYGDPTAVPTADGLAAALSRLDAEVATLAAHRATASISDDAERACAAMRSAAGTHAAAERAVDALSADRVQFLETSLEFHDRHGAQPCPVCAKGALDDEWVSWARTALAAEQEVASALRVARSGAHRARQALIAIVRAVDRPPVEGADQTTLEAARIAYESFSTVPVDDDTALADHVELSAPQLRAAYDALRAEVSSKLEIAGEAQTWLRSVASTVRP